MKKSRHTASDGSKDWIQDATYQVPMRSKRLQRKRLANAGSERETKIKRTLDAFLLAWKQPK